MKAISGYLENGRFTPYEFIKLPRRTDAILIIQEITKPVRHKNDRAWLDEFHRLLDESAHEELRDEDFLRADYGRELITFNDKE